MAAASVTRIHFKDEDAIEDMAGADHVNSGEICSLPIGGDGSESNRQSSASCSNMWARTWMARMPNRVSWRKIAKPRPVADHRRNEQRAIAVPKRYPEKGEEQQDDDSGNDQRRKHCLKMALLTIRLRRSSSRTSSRSRC